MHSDQKVGLALGIMLIGVTAALFFRNPPAVMTPGVLHSAEELDAAIAERAVSPYLIAEQADQAQPALEPLTPSLATTPETSPTMAGIGGAADQDPFANSEPPAFEAPKTASEESDATGLRFVSTQRDPAVVPPFGAEGNLREHLVQRGETLSSIAQKYLGSPHRYQAIYELNQDRLASPDELRDGIVLRIPPAASTAPPRIARQPE